MAYDGSGGILAADQGSTRKTIFSSLNNLAGKVIRAEDLLQINFPQNGGKTPTVSMGKLDEVMQVIDELSKRMVRINDTLEAL